jgi:hypothetical protein
LYSVLNDPNEEIILIRKVLYKEQGAVVNVLDCHQKINDLRELLIRKFKAKISLYVIDEDLYLNKSQLNENIKVFKSFDELPLFIV